MSDLAASGAQPLHCRCSARGRSSARHGPGRRMRRVNARRFFRTAACGAFFRSSRAPIRSRRWWKRSSTPGNSRLRLKAAIERKDDSASRVFFAPTHLRAGGSWSAQLAQEIAEATAFILLIGEAGIGKWQVPEYDEVLDKWVKSERTFPLIVVLLEGQTAPGLQFLRQLHWIITPDPASEKDIARLFDAASGGGSSPGELWRYTSPYRGLEAMEEKDSD